MILPAIASLFSLLTYRLLRVIFVKHFIVNPPALLAQRMRAALTQAQQGSSTTGATTSPASDNVDSLRYTDDSNDDRRRRGIEGIEEREALATANASIIPVKLYKAAPTAQESFLRDELYGEVDRQMFTARMRNMQALRDFFRDTGGKVTDPRVLRSAMYLSDEIDRAVRGIDLPNQQTGWRPYNRFYADGTQELFTNVPTGKSPLVLAAPKARVDLKPVDQRTAAFPVQYQATRRSKIQQVGRALDEIEQSELTRLVEGGRKAQETASSAEAFQNSRLSRAQREAVQQYKHLRLQSQAPSGAQTEDPLSRLQSSVAASGGSGGVTIEPLHAAAQQEAQDRNIENIHAKLYKPYQESAPSIKQRLFKFEGDIADKSVLEHE